MASIKKSLKTRAISIEVPLILTKLFVLLFYFLNKDNRAMGKSPQLPSITSRLKQVPGDYLL